MDDLKGLRAESLNIRYLAWKVDADPLKWASILKKKASIPDSRAKAIIHGSALTKDEKAAIAEGFSVVTEELGSDGLFGFHGQDLFKENIKYLVGRLPYGESQKMAAALKVAKETVSRWKKDGRVDSVKPSKILKYLGMNSDMDLYNSPLFLSTDPIGKFAVKKWLMDRINNTSSNELVALFPALKKLFSRNEDS